MAEQETTQQPGDIERLERELAEKDPQITKLKAQLRAVKDFNKVHQEQHAQSRENAKLLYTTLKRVAPDVLRSIEGALWQSTNEYDKLMSEGRRWQEKYQRLERELAESWEECRRLREALEALEVIKGRWDRLMALAAEAEGMREKAIALSNETDRLNTILDASDTIDHRKKEYRDYQDANKISSRAWLNFNQMGLRNIGLEVCMMFRREQQAAASLSPKEGDS